MQDYLTDLQKTKVEAFAADAELVDAVKKVLLQRIYGQGVIEKGIEVNPLKNRALVLVQGGYGDEDLGRRLRAFWEGVDALESGFEELLTIKAPKVDPIETPYNEAE